MALEYHLIYEWLIFYYNKTNIFSERKRREKKFEKNMDMENIRQVLEDAAQTFLSPANTITNERRREAEKVI
jgi:hypothetical protein